MRIWNITGEIIIRLIITIVIISYLGIKNINNLILYLIEILFLIWSFRPYYVEFRSWYDFNKYLKDELKQQEGKVQMTSEDFCLSDKIINDLDEDAREYINVPYIKEFIERLKKVLNTHDGDDELPMDWEESIDKLAGDKLLEANTK